MGRRALLVAQGAAVGVVVLLFALLVWKVVQGTSGGGLAAAATAGKAPEAPDFSADRLDRDGRLALSSLRGRAVLVNFFASWCRPACVDEVPELEKTWRANRRKGLVVLAVDWKDLRPDARGFMREHGVTYPAVYDGSGAIGTKYGVTGVPESFVLDREGRVVDAIIGSVNTDEDRAHLSRAVQAALAS